MNNHRDFARCVQQKVPKPWSIVGAAVYGEGFSLQLAAASADLGIAYRKIDARQQRFVDVGVGLFTHYTVFNPELLEFSLANGTIRPVKYARGVAATDLAPLSVYASGESSILLLNPAAGEFCVDHNIPAQWPNPFARCELVHGSYAAAFTFSSDAIASVPSLFARMHTLVDSVTPCLDQRKGRQHG